MFYNVMLDLETMGTRAGCAVASIGACRFDPIAGIVSKEGSGVFYRVIELQTCFDVGLKAEASTLYWWLAQSPEARASLSEDRNPLKFVLEEFSRWLTPNDIIWAHGANFDPPVLETAYRAIKAQAPWKYTNVRCTRTLYKLAGVSVPRSQGTTHHHALDDAINQSIAVGEAFHKLGLKSF